jgi:hypothetical protein
VIAHFPGKEEGEPRGIMVIRSAVVISEAANVVVSPDGVNLIV